MTSGCEISSEQALPEGSGIEESWPEDDVRVSRSGLKVDYRSFGSELLE